MFNSVVVYIHKMVVTCVWFPMFCGTVSEVTVVMCLVPHMTFVAVLLIPESIY